MTTHETPVTTNDQGYQEHPAFAVAVVNRRRSAPGASLFQSDIRHQHTVTLELFEADRHRDLNQDRVHQTKKIIEVAFSESQWASVVASGGIGSGVPATLEWRESVGRVPDIPFEPRSQSAVNEAKNSVDKMLAGLRDAVDVLSDVIENKQGIRAQREALRDVQIRLDGAGRSSAFAVESVVEQVESVVEQARADIAMLARDAAQEQSMNTIAASSDSLPQIERG